MYVILKQRLSINIHDNYFILDYGKTDTKANKQASLFKWNHRENFAI